MKNGDDLSGKVVLITGAAHRIGAHLARRLHAEGMNICLHYRSSREAAAQLEQALNVVRPNSVTLAQADLLQTERLPHLVDKAIKTWARLDVLINNASSFYPTPVGESTTAHWDDLMGSNLKAPYFLAQAAAPFLTNSKGCIVNFADTHAERPLKYHPIYSMAKAGVVMLTKSLARELGPNVRVNAIAPGAILWPSDEPDEVTKQRILSRVALHRQGEMDDIARAALYLIRDANYTTGQTIAVDGGRNIFS